jgi:hypothetical protein
MLATFRTYIKLFRRKEASTFCAYKYGLGMSKKPKMGRPPLPKGESREERLFCRFSLSEVAEIEAAARAAKKPKSEWIREALLTAARQVK